MALGISMTRILREKWLGFGRRRQDYFSASNPQISAPASLTPTVISDTEIDLSWSSVVSATNYVLQRATQSDYSDAVQIYSGSATSFNDTGLTGNTTYYYRVKAQATGYTDSDWTNASATTNAIPTTSDLVFATRTNLANNAQIFTATSGAGYGHTGLDALFPTVNQNCRIWAKMDDANCVNYVLGFNTVNAQTGFAGMEVAINVAAGGEVYFMQNGAGFSTGLFLSVGEYVGLFRVASDFKLQRSSDGVTWTDFVVYRGNPTYINAAEIYCVCDVYQAGGGKMAYPKLTTYGAGNISNLIIQYGNSLGLGTLDAGGSANPDIGVAAWYAIDTLNNYHYQNTSVGGQTISQLQGLLATKVYNRIGDGFTSLVMPFIEGTNTLVAKSGAAAFADLQTFISTVLAYDSRFKIAVYMCISGNTAFFSNAERVIYNNLIAGITETSRLKIIDITGTPELNDEFAWQNTTYYGSGGIHLTQTGYNLLASIGIPVITSF